MGGSAHSGRWGAFPAMLQRAAGGRHPRLSGGTAPDPAYFFLGPVRVCQENHEPVFSWHPHKTLKGK